jgi:hypothetical protein
MLDLERWLPGVDDLTLRPLPRIEEEHQRRLHVDELFDPSGLERSPLLPVAYALAGCASHLRVASRELSGLDVTHRVAALCRVARSWMDPSDEHRKAALRRLPGELATSEQTVAWALDATFESWTPERLLSWYQRSGYDRAVAAGPTAHTWAGNVFTAGLPPVVASLLAGIPALIKAPGRLPTFAALFARSVAFHAPELGPCVGAAAWPRTNEAATRRLIGAAADIFSFGDDASLDALALLADPTGARVHRFGDRYSIALATSHPPRAQLDALGDDLLAYDGLGCLTPRWLFVSGDLDAARTTARSAAPALEEAARRFPGVPLELGPGAARTAWLGTTGFAGWSRSGPGWAVAATEWDPDLGAPPPRCLHVVAVPDLAVLPSLLSRLGPRLQGCALLGVDAPPSGLLDGLSSLGLSRAVPAGELQRPPVDWIHDDVDPLRILRS